MKDRIPDYTWSGRRSFYQEQSTDFVEEPAVDELWPEVAALLSFDGDDGDTTTTDSGPNERVVSMSGGAEIDDAQSMFGGTSVLLPGSANNHVTITGEDGEHIPDEPITLEFWWRPARVDLIMGLVGNRNNSDGMALYQLATGEFNLQAYNSFTQVVLITAAVPNVIDTWYFIAITRTVAGFWNLWIDGVSVGSDTESDVVGDSGTHLTLGWDQNTAGRDAHGWIDEYRYTKGTDADRYFSAFARPSSAFPRSA